MTSCLFFADDIASFKYGTKLFVKLHSNFMNAAMYFRRLQNNIYGEVASSEMSHLEAHAGFFRLLMQGIFDTFQWRKWLSKSGGASSSMATYC